MILPSFQCATVTIVLLKDSPVDRSVRSELPVIAVQFPAAILIGWAIIVLGVDDSYSFSHWTCWSIHLVILPEKSTSNTSGLCISRKSVQFRLFHASKSSWSNRSRLAFASGLSATTTTASSDVWLYDWEKESLSGIIIITRAYCNTNYYCF